MHALEGVRLIDFGQYLAGPFGPMLLGDLGANAMADSAGAGGEVRAALYFPLLGVFREQLPFNEVPIKLYFRSKDADPDQAEQLWATALLYDRAGWYDKSHWIARWSKFAERRGRRCSLPVRWDGRSCPRRTACRS